MSATIWVVCALFGLPYVLVRWRESLSTSMLAAPNGQQYAHEYGHSTYYDVGQGPVIVLLHGFGSWQSTWHAVQPALVAFGFRVIGIDALGAGASARPRTPEAYTTDTQARMIINILTHLNITQYTLIGHSYGGRIALQVALYAPQSVQRVITIAPEVVATERPFIAKIVVIPIIGYALAYWSTSPQLVKFGLRSVSKRIDWVGAQHTTYAKTARVRGHLAGQISQSAAPKDGSLPVPRHLGEITCPVFVIWGADDPVFPAQHGVQMVERMPNAHIGIIPMTGHIPHEESFSEVLDFMRQALQ